LPNLHTPHPMRSAERLMEHVRVELARRKTHHPPRREPRPPADTARFTKNPKV
jgi:hypothetical protein